MNRALQCCAGVALALGGGCSSFNETHYFRDNADPRNYYRLHITGCAAFSSSRYMSGYFDESAVDTYFGEFTQPEKGRFLPATPTPPADDAEAPGSGNGTEGGSGSGEHTLTGDVNLQDRKLLLLLTTNSDAIATGIQSLAQNEAIATTLAGILNRGRITGSREAAEQLATAKARGKMIGDDGARLVLNLPDDADQPTTEKNMLEYAQILARYLGGPGSFASLDEAATWLNENRSRLERGLLKE